MSALAPLGERHRVVAATTDGRYVTDKALTGLTWHQAQAMWNELDAARVAGRLPLVSYLVVRSEADPDPRWCRAEYDFLPFVVGRQRGHAELRGAAKAWGASRGYQGLRGGWIYRSEDLERERAHNDATRASRQSPHARAQPYRARPYCQGWDSLVYGRNPRPVRQHERRWYWNDLQKLYVAAKAAA